MTELSSTAMVLAAGLGTRMRPLSLAKPKPLLEVGSRTMLDHALDRLMSAGIKRVVVNCYYLAEQIEDHLAQRKDLEIILSHEKELLDTGGGIKNALHHFDDKPFFALNADLPWMDGAEPSLIRMAKSWDAKKMDAMLLLMRTENARGFSPEGSFIMNPDGRIYRRDAPKPRPYVMISAQILKSDYFAATSERIFSNTVVWDEAETRHKLYGIEHLGSCYHVGTPEDLATANELLASGRGWL